MISSEESNKKPDSSPKTSSPTASSQKPSPAGQVYTPNPSADKRAEKKLSVNGWTKKARDLVTLWMGQIALNRRYHHNDANKLSARSTHIKVAVAILVGISTFLSFLNTTLTDIKALNITFSVLAGFFAGAGGVLGTINTILALDTEAERHRQTSVEYARMSTKAQAVLLEENEKDLPKATHFIREMGENAYLLQLFGPSLGQENADVADLPSMILLKAAEATKDSRSGGKRRAVQDDSQNLISGQFRHVFDRDSDEKQPTSIREKYDQHIADIMQDEKDLQDEMERIKRQQDKIDDLKKKLTGGQYDPKSRHQGLSSASKNSPVTHQTNVSPIRTVNLDQVPAAVHEMHNDRMAEARRQEEAMGRERMQEYAHARMAEMNARAQAMIGARAASAAAAASPPAYGVKSLRKTKSSPDKIDECLYDGEDEDEYTSSEEDSQHSPEKAFSAPAVVVAEPARTTPPRMMPMEANRVERQDIPARVSVPVPVPVPARASIPDEPPAAMPPQPARDDPVVEAGAAPHDNIDGTGDVVIDMIGEGPSTIFGDGDDDSLDSRIRSGHFMPTQEEIVQEILRREEKVRKGLEVLGNKARTKVEELRKKSSSEHNLNHQEVEPSPPSTPKVTVTSETQPTEQTLNAGRGKIQQGFLNLFGRGTSVKKSGGAEETSEDAKPTRPPHPIHQYSQRRLYKAQNAKYDAIKHVLGRSISDNSESDDE